ncbi:MAG: type II toxin-antitoxin system RelE/ParE family toxin [Erysipelotrichaceae bacterium]|jgi:phage-related protein
MHNGIEIEYYVKTNGDIPVKEFIDSFNIKHQARIIREIELLEIFGHELREPHSKKLVNGIFELRIRIDGISIRLFYFFTKKHKAILTNGFIKKVQKTPDSQIETAIKFRNDFNKRNR